MSSTAIKPISSTPTLVLGIIGSVIWVLLSAVASLFLGILGLYYWHRTEDRDGKRIAGLVLGIINVSLGGIGTIVLVLAGMIAATA